jgi:hypothetical protein
LAGSEGKRSDPAESYAYEGLGDQLNLGIVTRWCGLVAEDVDCDGDYNYYENGYRSEHSEDVEGGSVFLSRRRRGDAKEVDETGGYVSEQSHGC